MDTERSRPAGHRWLTGMLARNADTTYLRRFGGPRTVEAFRAQVPMCRYEDLTPWLRRLAAGESDILFSGRPVAFERTGGSSGGAKLIPYSAAGLADFRRNLCPWIEAIRRDYDVRGSVYFATSPVARAPQTLAGVPVGLPDGAYLGEEMGAWLATHGVAMREGAAQTDMAAWRRETVRALRQAADLELVSVWSPTFLLRLLDDIPDPVRCWPRLKLVSCWMAGASRPHAEALARRLPHARFEGKGLMSTEAVVSVPDGSGRAVLAPYGFVEFLAGENAAPLEAAEVETGRIYEAVVTTASGLYRYRSGDRVRVTGRADDGRPMLEFVGRALCCALVGEKLDDAFVARCLKPLALEAMLVPDARQPGYVLIAPIELPPAALAATERRLAANPQYAYARALGQLRALRLHVHPRPYACVERELLARGARAGDLKPLSLRREAFWLDCFARAA